ncbi:MAG: LysM peptidoglycan-binding domain-containing protein [Brachybacterium sp.]|nr:LysM peptidoglycan-binding domain-containing protein [Brachybacterium sp.]
MSRLIRGVGALLVLLALLFGAPLALLAWVGNPWPEGGWAEVQLLTNSTLIGLLAIIGWLAWAQMTACVLVEVAAAAKASRERGLVEAVAPDHGANRVVFATGGQQHLARTLVAWVAALGIGAGTLASAGTAHADTPTGHAPTVQTEGQGTEQDVGKQGASITAQSHTTLWRLAETHLDDGRQWRQLLELNRGAKMADNTVLANAAQTIPAGTTIRLPAGASGKTPTGETQKPEPTGRHTEVVQDDEYLSLIAKREMGDATRWRELYTANKDVIGSDPNLIYPGQRLVIPGSLGANEKTTSGHHSEGRDSQPPTHEQPPENELAQPQVEKTPEQQPTAPAESAPETDSATETPGTDAAGPDSAEGDEDHAFDAPWVLAGLAGGGTLLAGALFLGLRQRRRAQFRRRRPGRGIAAPAPELAATERTIIAAGAAAAATVEFMDQALRRLAAHAEAHAIPMPPLAAVEIHRDTLTLHLSGPAALPHPWQATPDQLHWHCDTNDPPEDLGPDADNVEPPYPMLATIGQGDDGETWLLNCEELGTISVAGDLTRGRDFARHIAAQLAVNPWSHAVAVECVGLGEETAGFGARITYHPPGDPARSATAEVLADAVAMVDRTSELEGDAPTGRTGQLDADTWPAQMLVVDAASSGPDGLDELIEVIAGHAGRTGTSIVLVGEGEDGPAGEVLRVTSAGRVIVEKAGLNLSAIGLTADEARGCALLYAQSEVLDDTEIPVDEHATEGWEAYVDRAGSLRREYTLPRNDRRDEPTSRLLTADDEHYLNESAVVAEDLERLAPQVTEKVRHEVEDKDPNLDQDVADWFARDCARPRLMLLGPVTAHTHGTALASRKPYFTELLAFLALRRRRGVTNDEIQEAFGITSTKVRDYVGIVRDWLGPNPATGEKHLPWAGKSQAAQTSGMFVYQVDDGLLIDVDLFRRLRKRGETRGDAAGLADHVRALELINGRPFDQLRPGGWSWLVEGERIDQYMTIAIADVALVVTTAFLEAGDLPRASEAARLAVLAAPDEEATRLSLAAVTEAEGDRREAQRILREDVCNRTDDDNAPPELSDRTQAIIRNHKWLETG